MKVQDIEKLIKLDNELSDLCWNIFYYVKDKYKDCLEFNKYSSYNKYTISNTGICIEYSDSDYGYDNINWLPDIPIELLETEFSWQQFLDDYYEKKRKEKEQKEAKEEQDKEDKECELYEKLKQKYEK